MSISNEQDLTMLLLSISIFSLSTIILWFTIEKRSLFSIFVFSGIYLLSGNIFISLSIGCSTAVFFSSPKQLRQILTNAFWTT
ncbi:unnamed protein product [Rotaria magnacalcarata]